MADEMKPDAKPDEEEPKEGEKHVAYKMLKALGDNKEGDVVTLPEEVGKMLVEIGHAVCASAEDLEGAQAAEDEADADEYGTEPVIANSIDRLAKDKIMKAETDIAAAVAAEIAKLKPKETVETVPAVPNEGPIYKSNGAYIKGIIKADIFGDNTEKNRVMAHQESIRKIYEKMSDRYETKAILGINETTPGSGGYLVNPQFSPDVYRYDHGQINLLDLCTRIDAQSNTLNYRSISESSLANGSIYGGLNMVATAEGNTLISSLPAWQNIVFTLVKEAIFAYFTVEVLQDSSYPLESDLNQYVEKAFLYGLNTQLVQGTALEGLLNAPSLVTVTHSADDTSYATTPKTNLTYADLAGIWSRVYPDSQVSEKGIWCFHPGLVNPLTQLAFTFGGASPAWGLQYDAQSGLDGSGSGFPGTPYRIFGKRAFPVWACSAPGNAGDIFYCDFGTVRNFQKPFRVEVSKEFQFGTDQVAVKFVNRLDAKTLWRSTITGPSGSTTFSAIVTRSGGIS